MTTEFEAVTRELRNWNPGVTVVSDCAVCDKPVLDSHDPTPIYDRSDSDTPSGFIHGAFDCSDSYACPVGRSVSAGGGASGVQVCLLPDAHGDDGHLWGEPS